MNAAEVLTELQAAGVTITRHGDRLRLAPPQAVPANLLQRVRECKASLLRLVPESTPPISCFTCRGSDFWRGMVRYTDGTEAPGPWICCRCHPRPKNDAVGSPRINGITQGKVIAPPQNQKGA